MISQSYSQKYTATFFLVHCVHLTANSYRLNTESGWNF